MVERVLGGKSNRGFRRESETEGRRKKWPRWNEQVVERVKLGVRTVVAGQVVEKGRKSTGNREMVCGNGNV